MSWFKGPIAAIDLGSNSFLLTIARCTQGELEVLFDDCIVTRLGQGVNKSRQFHPEALERVEACFKYFREKMNEFKVSQVCAVATSAARDVKNKEALLRLGEKYKIPIEIISGSREAQLTYLGAKIGQNQREGEIVIDVGGGSTEIIALNERGQAQGFSLDIGSVRLTEMFISEQPIKDGEWAQLQTYIGNEIKKQKNQIPSLAKGAIAVAGTPTTLAGLIQGAEFNAAQINGSIIELSVINQWISKLKAMPLLDRFNLPGMQPGREDVIVAGLEILSQVLEYYHLKNLQVSVRGVRYGILYEKFGI